MRVLEGERTLVRIFVGDSDKWQGKPLEIALVERLRTEGFAGVTVLRGISGFGAASVVHTAHVLDLSADLPIVVEVVEDEEHTGKLLSILDEMLTDSALVTLEKVRVVKYGVKN